MLDEHSSKECKLDNCLGDWPESRMEEVDGLT